MIFYYYTSWSGYGKEPIKPQIITENEERIAKILAPSRPDCIYFFAELGPADESTWSDPNFMKTDPQCRAITHNDTRCPNNSTPSHDFFCRIHILHPPTAMYDDLGLVALTEFHTQKVGRK